MAITKYIKNTCSIFIHAQLKKTCLSGLALLALIILPSKAQPNPESDTYIPSNEEGQAHPFTSYRRNHTITLMNDGRLLIAGGERSYRDPIKDIEIYDSKQQRFFRAPATHFPHSGHTAIHLHDDRIIIVGGLVTDNAKKRTTYSPEIWNPNTATWTTINEILFDAEEYVYAAEIKNGKVLFIASNERAILTSTQANTQQYRSWLWDPQNNSVSIKNIISSARIPANIAVLRNGKVLFFGGNKLSFFPSKRCEEIPPEQARAQGVADGNWCLSHGIWDTNSQQNAELWDSDSGELSLLPVNNTAPTERPTHVQQLRSGDVFIAYQSGHLNQEAPAFIWSASEKHWQKIADLPAKEQLNFSHPLVELADGSLLGRAHRYSIAENRWEALLNNAVDATLLSLSKDQTVALSTIEPYLKRLDINSWVWRVSTNGYWRTQNNTSLALQDGRLMVVGSNYENNVHQMVVQFWSPNTNHWELQQAESEQALEKAQLVQLASGDVIHVGLMPGGVLQCRRWTFNTVTWSDCGQFSLTPIAPDPHVHYANEKDRPARYNFALDTLEDGRVLLVLDLEHAQLYNEHNNQWLTVTLKSNQQPLARGAPVRTPLPLYVFQDEVSSSWQDASKVAMHYQQGDLSDNITAAMLWDSHEQQWAYILPAHTMGSKAAFLPDGCAISWNNNDFHLFTPASGKVTKLALPQSYTSINGGSFAVLRDGTITQAGTASNIYDTNSGFFAEQANCNGFVSVTKKATISTEMQSPPQKAITLDTPNAQNSPFEIRELLVRYRWDFIAGLIPLALYLLLRKFIRRSATHDNDVNISSTKSFIIRLIIYGLLAIIFGPMLWTTILLHISTT